ncbi:nucleotidyltransferase family protein [Paenibacillus oralis]|uniref:Nucleotidyltransferase family protein n=1 Tax=Paenibacillus oralis TaxID=2490856 RepID=A0A3P3UC44_9BACL|nr:nucleotidyltransferase family protein [Paenibacillus oralis]RRJ67724.1 nucleotidyltransferase family protein [Paenibacillus oralis]
MNDATGLREAILQQPEMLEDLRAVAELGLPQGCIAAGYVRNFAWDVLHGYTRRTPLHDVDVLYYDPKCLDEAAEKQYEAALRARSPLRNWSVKNQARMHLRNGEKAPYRSVEDAMRYWPETATAVGVRLHPGDDIELLAPWGLDDLLSLKVRQSPCFRDTVVFRQRVTAKEWLRLWPRLQLIEE